MSRQTRDHKPAVEIAQTVALCGDMATILTHAIAGAALVPLFLDRGDSAKWTVAAATLAMIPDLDVTAFSYGIPYGSPFGHRGVTHSLVFALLCGLGAAQWLSRPHVPTRLRACLVVATASHGLIDMCTNGGKGVGLLIPFTMKRYFFPWRPIEVSPIGVDFFFSLADAWAVLRTEIFWVWIPAAVVYTAARALRPRRHAAIRTASRPAD